MKASSANLLNLIKGPKQFIIPIYQRTYSWHLSQCEQLFKDILRVSQDDDSNGHFVGSVVYFQEGVNTISDVPKLLVIDGQQRLTTVTLLIAALAEFIKDNTVNIGTKTKKLQEYYLFNALEEGELRYKLLLTRRDKQSLIDCLNGVDPSESSSQRITENFQFFKTKINRENVQDIYSGLMRLFIVDVALEKDVDNPQLIFESMNSTGLDLSQADLIRNYVLMGQKLKLQTELYEKYWFPMEQGFGNEYATRFDSFMRDYLIVKTGKIPKISNVYEEFKIYVQAESSPLSISSIVEDVFHLSKFYTYIVLHKEPEQSLLTTLKRISHLKVDVSHPFLLAVYTDYDNKLLTKDEFLEILILVENYVFRRAICGIPTNSMNKTFANLYKSVEKENYLDSVIIAFGTLNSYKRLPLDAEFERELVSKDVYNFRNRNYLLDRLENFDRKERVNVDEYTIEHILPQNKELREEWKQMLGEQWGRIQEEHLHTLGNLTLTGYNSELSDRPFKMKKEMEGGFDDSPIRLNDFLQKTEVWNESKITLRAKELADKAKQIWYVPSSMARLVESVDINNKQAKDKDYSIENYEYLQGYMLELYEHLKTRILNIDSTVTEEYKKLYIAFKSSTNFVDIVPQKSRLRLSLNMKYKEIHDPKQLCKDVSDLGRWGNGEIEVGLSEINEIDNVMELIEQSFDSRS